MALGLSTAIRASIVNVIRTAIDAGSGAGKLRIYNGVRPSTGGTATTLLADITLNDPCASASTDGILTLTVSPQPEDASANATGTATWARFVDSADTFVADGSVGLAGSGADVIISSTSIEAGSPVVVTSATLTAGNA